MKGRELGQGTWSLCSQQASKSPGLTEAAGLALWEGDSFPGMRSQLGRCGLQARLRPRLGWGQGPACCDLGGWRSLGLGG